MAGLRGWWQDRPAESDVAADIHRRLGSRTPVKRWLTRLLAHRLEMLVRESAILDRLVMV